MNKITKILMAMIFVFTAATTANAGKVYVGTNSSFAPFEYKKGGEIVGFDMDLIKAIADVAKIEIEIKDMSFDGLLPALQMKKIDMVMSGMTATDDRRKSVDFSNPYYSTSQVVLTQKDAEDIASFDDLKGKKVGVPLGTTSDVLVTKVEGTDIVRYKQAYMAILNLNNKKVDAVVLDKEQAHGFIEQNKHLKINTAKAGEEEYSMAVGKGNKELLEKLNAALKVLKENGTYDKLIKKWF
ncbi:Amino acid-binding protein [hydrothermal vent metagenome]|uniref:Amino acid-binding protein n=1 Tax=hydrothermal vent metagenome TaxID=652676 RepID=A0A1W1EBW9_9ZZZZ